MPDPLGPLKQRGRPTVPRRLRALPVRSLVPNVLTVLALCMGLTAIRMALQENFKVAVNFLILAAVFDMLDGRIARLLKGSTKFGAELDSLSDFLSFGVAPALILYMWSLHDLKGLGWIVVLAFAVCCALRLARFNVMAEDADRPAWTGGFFVGVPAPAAAGVAMMPLYLDFMGLSWVSTVPILTALFCAIVAFLMVSQIPTFSGKQMGSTIKRENVLPLLLCVALLAAFLVNYTWTTLTVLGAAYLGAIPFSLRRYGEMKLANESAPTTETEIETESEDEKETAE